MGQTELGSYINQGAGATKIDRPLPNGSGPVDVGRRLGPSARASASGEALRGDRQGDQPRFPVSGSCFRLPACWGCGEGSCEMTVLLFSASWRDT